VSKAPQSGEYLSKGGFVIRGKKNFVSISTLCMGFGIFFYSPRANDLTYDENLMRKEQEDVEIVTETMSQTSFTEIDADKRNTDVIENSTSQVEEAEAFQATDFRHFITNPATKQEIVYALPVVAPFSAIRDYRFRGMLIPGLMRRSEIQRHAKAAFFEECKKSFDDQRARLQSMIKSLSDQDVLPQLLSDCKFVEASKESKYRDRG